jgi:uncharacterized protein (TIGR03067 family)
VARFCWLLFLFAPFTLGCEGARPAAARKPILGTWEAVSAEAVGHQIGGKDAQGMRITFAEGKARWELQTGDGWKSFKGLCRIDPQGHSGWIDLGQPKSQDPTRVALGIYKIEGDTLGISMDKERPLDFNQPALAKLKLKRFKPRSSP